MYPNPDRSPKPRPKWDTGVGPFLREMGKRFLLWGGVIVLVYLVLLVFQAISSRPS